MLERAGVTAARRTFLRQVDARYARQSYELLVPAPARRLDRAAIAEIANAFHARHAVTYGHNNATEPVEIVSLRLTAIGAIPPIVIRQQPAAADSEARKARRIVFFRSTGAVEADIYERSRMPADLTVRGPVVIESLESTALVPPGWRATMDGDGFLLLARCGDGR